MSQGEHNRQRGFFASRTNIVFVAFLAISGFFLVAEHQAHVLGFLPWLVLLLCPLLHLFMHGGHGHEDADPSGRARKGPERPHH